MQMDNQNFSVIVSGHVHNWFSVQNTGKLVSTDTRILGA